MADYWVNPTSKYSPGYRGNDQNGNFVTDQYGNARYTDGPWAGVGVGDKWGGQRLGVGPDYYVDPNTGISTEYVGTGGAPSMTPVNDSLTGGTGGGGGTGSSAFKLNVPDYTRPADFSFREFNGQSPFSYSGDYGAYTPIAAFVAPTMQEVESDPAFQFRIDQGQKGIERSAAARGNLLTSGLLQDLADYRSDEASQEFDKIYGRRFNEWQAANQNNQATYALNRDTAQMNFNNKLGAWNANESALEADYDRDFGTAYKTWLANTQAGNDWWDRQFQQATTEAGLQNQTIEQLISLAGLGR